jgi:hypothetical protein
MFRTIIYFLKGFKHPFDMIGHFRNPKRVIMVIKSQVASNWYLDIKYSDWLDEKEKEHLLWFMDAKIQERYNYKHKQDFWKKGLKGED